MISSVDIPGMILNQFRTKIKGKYKKLFPNEPGNHTIISENYYTRGRDLFNNCWGHRFMRFRRALFEWPYKYIYSSDGKHELYDLGKDVKETSNLIGRFPDISASLHSKLQQFVESRKKSIKILNQTQLTEEEIRRLKSLGYL